MAPPNVNQSIQRRFPHFVCFLFQFLLRVFPFLPQKNTWQPRLLLMAEFYQASGHKPHIPAEIENRVQSKHPPVFLSKQPSENRETIRYFLPSSK